MHKKKPSLNIESLSPDFVDRVIAETGQPDYFVDSPEGNFRGMPAEDDPQYQKVVSGLMKTLEPSISGEVVDKKSAAANKD